jgi:hypothetical protein
VDRLQDEREAREAIAAHKLGGTDIHKRDLRRHRHPKLRRHLLVGRVVGALFGIDRQIVARRRDGSDRRPEDPLPAAPVEAVRVEEGDDVSSAASEGGRSDQEDEEGGKERGREDDQKHWRGLKKQTTFKIHSMCSGKAVDNSRS